MQPVDERCGFNQVAFGAVGRQSIAHLGQGQGGVRVGTIQVPVGGIKKHKLENMWGGKRMQGSCLGLSRLFLRSHGHFGQVLEIHTC